MCPPENPSAYIGETARNLYTRGKEHENNYRKDSPQSFMTKYQTEKHYGEAADFTAKVTVCFKNSFSRQISQGVYIRRSDCEVLNSKAEWHQPALWRVRNEQVSNKSLTSLKQVSNKSLTSL